MPPLLPHTATAIGLPVLSWALWNTARLARANRNGTAGMDVAVYGLLPREELDASEYDPTAPECADATLAARQGDWRPGAALVLAGHGEPATHAVAARLLNHLDIG
jgi:hypothetical protein